MTNFRKKIIEESRNKSKKQKISLSPLKKPNNVVEETKWKSQEKNEEFKEKETTEVNNPENKVSEENEERKVEMKQEINTYDQEDFS